LQYVLGWFGLVLLCLGLVFKELAIYFKKKGDL